MLKPSKRGLQSSVFESWAYPINVVDYGLRTPEVDTYFQTGFERNNELYISHFTIVKFKLTLVGRKSLA